MPGANEPTPVASNPAFIEDMRTSLETREALAKKWGVGTGTISKYRKQHGGMSATERSIERPGLAPTDPAERETKESSTDGTRAVEFIRDRPVTLEDAREWIRSSGDDPEDYVLSVRSIGYGPGLSSNRMSAVPKRKPGGDGFNRVSHERVMDAIRDFTFIPEPRAYSDESLVVEATDLQIGKRDWGGASPETVGQALESFGKAAEFAKSERPREICVVDAGDIVENIWSTSAQLGTNDLDLPHQIVEAAYVMQRGIQMLAPLTPSLRYAAVSSNHGQHRLGFKAPAGDAHADFGIAVAKMLAHGFELNPDAFGHVTVQTPEPYMESLYFETSGTGIGVVHGHQVNSADKIGDWWRGQSHGRMPVSQADLLLVGHWHSLRIQQSGDARWIFVGPASDRGSSWFTNGTGERSESGMLMFTTANGRWANLDIV